MAESALVHEYRAASRRRDVEGLRHRRAAGVASRMEPAADEVHVPINAARPDKNVAGRAARRPKVRLEDALDEGNARRSTGNFDGVVGRITDFGIDTEYAVAEGRFTSRGTQLVGASAGQVGSTGRDGAVAKAEELDVVEAVMPASIVDADQRGSGVREPIESLDVREPAAGSRQGDKVCPASRTRHRRIGRDTSALAPKKRTRHAEQMDLILVPGNSRLGMDRTFDADHVVLVGRRKRERLGQRGQRSLSSTRIAVRAGRRIYKEPVASKRNAADAANQRNAKRGYP